MFISPIIIQHGIIALEKEIARLEELHKAYGNEWPPDFDPNDIWIYDLLLKEFREHENDGYQENSLNSKPFRFFIALIMNYLDKNELSQEVRAELLRLN